MANYSAGSASVDIGSDLTGFHHDLERKLNAIEAEFDVRVAPDVTGFAQRLEADLSRLDATFGVGIAPDITGFAPRLDAELSMVRARLDVDIDPDLTGFGASVEAELARLDGIEIEVPIRPTFSVAAQLAARGEIERFARTLHPRVTIDVDVDRDRLGALGFLGGSGGGGLGGVTSSTRSISQLGGAAGNTAGQIGGLSSSMGSLASAAGSGAAGVAVVVAVVGLIAEVVPVALGAIGSLGIGLAGLATVAGPAIGAVAVGLQGLGEAFTAGEAASSAAGQDAEAAAKRYESSVRTLGDAQRTYERSVRDEVRAQEDVTRARKGAQEQLEDLALTVRGGVIAEQGAVLALAQARIDASKIETGETPLDRANKLQRVAEAEQRLLEIQERNKDLSDDVADQGARGVEGSDQVVAAKQRLFDAEERVTTAQQGVRDAQDAVNEAMTSGSSTADAYAQALEQLSPNAREFVTAMRALNEEGGAWHEFSMSVQDGLFDGTADTVTNLANTVLPAITPAMTDIARSVGGIVESISDVLTGPAGEQLTTLLTAIPQFFTAVTPGIEATTQGFMSFGAALAPAMESMGAGFGTFLGRIGEAFTEMEQSGTLTAAFDGFGQAMAGLGEWVGPLVTMFGELGATVGPILGDMFTSFGRTVELMTPAMNQIADVFGNHLVVIFEALEPVMPALTQAFADFFTAVQPLSAVFAELGATVLTGAAQGFSTFAVAMAPVAKTLADELAPIIPILADYFADTIPIIADVSSVLSQKLTQAVADLAPYLPEIVRAAADLAIALIPLAPQFVDLATAAIPPITDALVVMAPHIADMITLFTNVAEWLLPKLIPALQGLEGPVSAFGGYFTSMALVVAGVWDGIVNTIKGAVGQVGQIIKGIGDKTAPLPGNHGEQMQRLGQSMIDWGGRTSDLQGGLKSALAPVPGNAQQESELEPGVTAGKRQRRRGYAVGGRLRGDGTWTSDSIPILASDGEFIVRAASTHKYLPLLEAINNDTLDLPGFATGGAVGRASGWAASKDGIPYVLGGLDCSMYASGVYQVLTGGDPDVRAFDTTKFATPQLAAAMGFEPGLGGLFSVGVTPLPGASGHMAFTLGGVNGESGGGHGVMWGQYAAGADDPQFSVQYHLPGYLFDPPTADTGGFASLFSNDGIYVLPGLTGGDGAAYGDYTPGDLYGPGMLGGDYEDSWNRVDGYTTDPRNRAGEDKNLSVQEYGRKAGEIGANWLLGIVGLENSILSESNVYNRAYNDVQKFADDRGAAERAADLRLYDQMNRPALEGGVAGEAAALARQYSTIEPFTYSAPNPPPDHVWDPTQGAEQWYSTVEEVAIGTGRPISVVPPTIEQIGIESSGNPDAINDWDINAQNGDPSIGLLQMIGETYDRYADPRYPGGRTVPKSNIAAAFNYVDAEYGGVHNIWPKVMGYANGGPIEGPGGPRDDLIPILASNGEFMVHAEAAAANRPLLEAMNAGARWSRAVLPSGSVAPSPLTGGSVTHDRSINYGDVHVGNQDELFAIRERDTTGAHLAALGAHW
ncbi:transglycosylase SLT domain-containing protein [Prescottella equi]|uniref:transglycosylase SLT domain-containing protein n=1 Tax=Rhodococcus hoagii TaxID=43767 RepID=UPI0007CD91B1|nr:transglycosylase SLT domain-containing protein [Prescottella equi]